jgi:microsomal epoxide hydrolase
MSVQPFTIRVEQRVLDDLQQRLAQTRWPSAVDGAGWNYGIDLGYLKQLVAYWRDEYDWRAQEAALNRLAHFRVTVGDDVGIHVVHERGRGPDPLPIVLTHGWPDSFARMRKLIPLLTDPAAHGGDASDAFDVVVPSLPGYAFSDIPTTPGTSARTADWWAALMTALGYRRFGAAGGDIGSLVSQQLGQRHDARVLGLHLTDVPWTTFYFFRGERSTLSKAEQSYFARGERWARSEGAYAAIQSTHPHSLACGLNDSPAGLAAWIVDKFYRWSDCGGDLESRFTKDELLTNVMLYWVTGTIGASFLPYYEPAHGQVPADVNKRVGVPTGFAIFPKDLVTAPREWAERFFNVQRWYEMPRGGHFAALEEPQLLADEIRAFFRRLR